MPLDDDLESQSGQRRWIQQQCHRSTLLTTLCLATVLSALWIHHRHLTSRIQFLEDKVDILQTVTLADVRHNIAHLDAAATTDPDHTRGYPLPPANDTLNPALTTRSPASTAQSTSAQQSAAGQSESGSGTGIDAENADSGSGGELVENWMFDDDWLLEPTDDEDILKRTRGRRSAQLQDEDGNDDDDVMMGDENPVMRTRRTTTTRRPPRAKHVRAKSVTKQRQ